MLNFHFPKGKKKIEFEFPGVRDHMNPSLRFKLVQEVWRPSSHRQTLACRVGREGRPNMLSPVLDGFRVNLTHLVGEGLIEEFPFLNRPANLSKGYFLDC